VSGIRLTADVARPQGQRITAIEVGDAPLDPERRYKVATNDFLARGSDGFLPFARARPVQPVDDSPPLANEVMVFLRRLGTVRTGTEGRIVLR
jgi:2',3'-cyclic-nucleotide 2'-phosphodiesterase (5'-nucleotidase family)